MILPTRPAVLLALVLAGCSSSSLRRDTHERMNAVLWMQTSAEYRALTEMTWRQAADKVERLVEVDQAGLSSAALEQCGTNEKRLPPAVVVDVDETVLDNMPMNGDLIDQRNGWSQELWEKWVELRRASFVHGAEEFLKRMRAADVAVYFVTNRKLSEKACTLESLGPTEASADKLLTVGEIDPYTREPWTKEKKTRREAVARQHWILAIVGDDLADFLPGVRERVTAEDRVAAMLPHLDRFGNRWFLLPNPAYGSWEDALAQPEAPTGRDALLEQKWKKLKRMPTDRPDREEPSPCLSR